jgi:hypothetical protein
MRTAGAFMFTILLRMEIPRKARFMSGRLDEVSKLARKISHRRTIKNLGGKAGHICVSSISKTRSTAKYSNFYLLLL